MDKRQEQRKKARILVKIDGKSAIMNNFSQKGMQVSANSAPTRKHIEISFNFSGQDFTLRGSIQWIHKRFAGQNAYQFGCQLIETPLIYDTLLFSQ